MNDSDSGNIDLLICAKWIIPVVPRDCVLVDHAIAVSDRKIIDILPSEAAQQRFQAQQIINLESHAVIPGLINAHGHSAMSLLRGIADDLPLMQWLEEHIWPLEAKHVNADFVKQGASLAIAEMISSGTTCFADMYFFPEEVASAALDAKVRAQLACPVLDFPTVWAQDADEYIFKTTQLHDSYRNSELISTAFGPHAPYTVSDEPLKKLSVLAEELDIPIHMHIHETTQEVEDALRKSGQRPLERLAKLGLVSPRLNCVHGTELNDADIALLAQQQANVIHCPESNMKLASGFCEVARLQDSHINVALGTDGCASNNDLDMFSEMRSAALLAKAVAKDASALPAPMALEMATINGARALGLESSIGSLEAGKLADITAVDLDALNTTPVYDPQSQLVYATNSKQVSHVWCGGKLLYQQGEFTSMDITQLKASVAQWRQTISEQE